MPDLTHNEPERRDTAALERVAPGGALAAYRPGWEPEEEETLSLGQLVGILLRRKWLILAVAVVVLGLVAIQTLTTSSEYRATATLQVDPVAPRVLPYEPVTESSFTPQSTEEYLQTQASRVKTMAVARRVVEGLALTEEPRFKETPSNGVFLDILSWGMKTARKLFSGGGGGTPDATSVAASAMLEDLDVSVVRGTRLLQVGYTSPYPELAARIVQGVVEQYIELHFESNYEATTRVTDFLETQLQELEARLQASETALLDYARSHHIVTLDDRTEMHREQLASLTQDLARVQSLMLGQQAKVQALRGVSVDGFPESLRDDTIDSLERRLSEARQSLAVLGSRYGAEWPAVKDTRLEIDDLERQLTAAKQAAIGNAVQESRIAQENYRSLQEAIRLQETVVDELNGELIQYNILKREVESNQSLYEGLLLRLKEAGVAAGLRASNVTIADLPEIPRTPSSPQSVIDLALGVFAGLLLGLVLALAIEALDSTLKTSDDIAHRLRLPTLAVIPSILQKGASRRRLPWRRRKGMPEDPLLAYGAEEYDWQPAWEAYRSLRTSILLSHSGKPPRTLLFTSALSGEGKTMTALNAGLALAQTGARTLLVDLDLRQPGIAGALGIESSQGMSTFLSGNSDLSSQIRETSSANLFVVPAGPIAPNPAELLGAERMRTGIDLLHEYFTYIVIDTPPVLEVTDAAVVAPLVDGVILVSRAGKTPRDAARRASNRLQSVGARFLGAVLNDVDARGADYGVFGESGYYAPAEGTRS